MIDTHTRLCGILGNPVEHSLSPAIHNAAFHELGLNFVYLAFPVVDLAGAIKGIRALGNVRGFSVTIPHKVAVIPYLDEVEPTVRHIGSVNTIVVQDGKLIGSNTDASGALRALRDGGVELKGRQVLMLGSGGAARAIAFALAAEGELAGLKILGIEDMERQGLVHDLNDRTRLTVTEGPLSRDQVGEALKNASVVVHCTPVGMHPNVGETVVDKAHLQPHLSVMDIVYNPLETRLLREAKERGCRIVSGIEMFLNQAVGQFELWTGRSAPTDVMRSVLKARFT